MKSDFNSGLFEYFTEVKVFVIAIWKVVLFSKKVDFSACFSQNQILKT